MALFIIGTSAKYPIGGTHAGRDVGRGVGEVVGDGAGEGEGLALEGFKAGWIDEVITIGDCRQDDIEIDPATNVIASKRRQ
jgi:hypothetical protein